MTNRITTPPKARTVIVGVDTHKHVHVAVAIDSWGIRLGDHAFVADSCGYEALVTWAETHGRIEAFGFCFGGSMSNTLAVLLGADLAAAAPFYGGAPAAEDVAKIRTAMLIHHGALDTRLVEAYPDYEAAMQANNVTHEGHIYPDSVHGFFNDATPERYNQVTAEEAWMRTIAWFNRYTREAA